MVQQGEHAELPPFDNLTFSAGDIIVVGGTRKNIIDLLTRDPGLYSEIELKPGDQIFQAIRATTKISKCSLKSWSLLIAE